MLRWHSAALVVIFALASGPSLAKQSTPAPRDAAYPGTITLQIDATDLDRRIFRTQETIPVKPGALTLHYPQWLPGIHAPAGPVEALGGLIIRGNGQRVEWVRDPLDMYSFHLTVPNGVKELQVEFQYISPLNPQQGRVMMTPEMLGVDWEKVLLYPAGYYSSRIPVSASVVLPSGWQYATALETRQREGEVVYFRSTSLEILVDSPLFAGRYSTRVDLDPGAKASVHLNVLADSPNELEIKPEQLALHRKLVQEITQLFGSRHFDHYDFLFALSENFGGTGLEHHRSSENVQRPGYFKDADKTITRRLILPHEFTHSWNGKFRRPADQRTGNFNVPLQDSLLWVYEGQTNYWDLTLAARCGLWTEQMARDALAARAATLQDKRPGREWRNLQDTNNQSIIAQRRPQGWTSWQRTEDYYSEGGLIWLDVDTKLRELTHEQRSLDDFARAFFGVDDGSYAATPYTFEDIVKILNGLAPYDWAGMLRQRLDGHGPGAPLEGLERSGWRLAYAEEPSEYLKKAGEDNDTTDLSYSIGVVLDKEGRFTEVVWNGPAFKAGLSTANTLIAVNGRAYKPELLRQAIRAAKDKSTPVVLLVKNGDRYRSVTLDYSGGLRYPRLERIENTPDRLSDILRSKTKT